MKDLKYDYPVKYAELSNGINLAYIDEGKGSETILMIHGLGSYLPAWKKNINELSKNYRVIAIDLPGYGKSSKAPHSGLMTFYAGVIAEFIQQLNIGPVNLAGHSMGGQISMVLALEKPELVKRLILVDPAGFEAFHAGQRNWFKDVMTPNLVRLTSLEAIETNLASNFFRMPADARFMIEDRIAMRDATDFDAYCLAVARSVHGMVDEPVLDKISAISVPTLIFFGENDMLIPNRYLNPGFTVKIAETGANLIKGSKLVMVPKCGHFMMFEKSDVFNEETKKFIQ
ncbi:MAG: alpha/beta hydrolase [Lentimicrobiaceae bacterium]|nr:alpha/beta hydrolase [Lentimicrobiaceae bacterium]MCB9023259.1 alpha/beta hydrolase [Lentimicrobiaceae bacterium]MCO5266930.1 alpha/beta hydrolase [Lentimicrobium sp.]